ncbi:MAG: DNA primase [Ruminococcaceae bacterium]|nr:DNA primase [Oscillospiraceae bacterium]
MMIPREVVEEVRRRTDIVELIGSYVTLKRAGSNFGGLCPFHSEKTPSFTVFPDSESFYCFGCGAGGDAITFVMKNENLDYPSAVEVLAARAGIQIVKEQEKSTGGLTRKRVHDMNKDAAKFFHQCLLAPIGAEGLKYLTEKRGLSMALIKHFGLGFAPGSFNMLTDYMHKKGYTDAELAQGFLCGISQKNGRAYDYFRNRVMFPIIDTAGNVIAFGGRVMDDSKPKYLNSSDTPAFQKRKNLFALNFAKNHSTDRLILCEGYMDVISLHAYGFENAVATLGTAITPEQARLMTKYTKQVIICYDADEAGQRAAVKAMEVLGQVGMDVRVLHVNDAKDPDEYLRKFGDARFRRLIEGSRTEFSYKSEKIFAKYSMDIPEERIKASEELCALIAATPSKVEREIYASMVADKLKISIDSLKNDIERTRSKKLRALKQKESKDAGLSAKGYGDRVNPDTARNVQAVAAEEAIIGLLMLYPEHRKMITSGTIALTEEDFFSALGKRAFARIMKMEQEEGGFSYSLLGEDFTPDEMGRLQSMLQKRRALAENGTAVLRASVTTLLEQKRKSDARESGDVVQSIQQLLDAKKKKQ